MIFWIAAAASFSATLASLALARRFGWLTRSPVSGGRRPAVIGGWPVLISWAAAAAWTSPGAFAELLPFWAGLLIIFAMGARDDFAPLTPRAKFALQILAASVFLGAAAATGQLPLSLWTPLFLLWTVGISNALNLLDNMDGVAPGVGAVAAAFMALLAWPEASLVPLLLWGLSGCLCGFLAFNFHPARIYLGDGGSHLIGFSLSALPLTALPDPPQSDPGRLAALVLLLGVPALDTAFVSLTRTMRGTPLWLGGKDHIAHRLERRGLPVPLVSLLAYLAAAVCGAAAIAADG